MSIDNKLYLDPIPVYNEDSYDCPGFGLLRISSHSAYVDGKTRFKVSRPNGTLYGSGMYLFAGPQGIAAGKSGVAYSAEVIPKWVLYDSAGNAPAIGAMFGPSANSFKVYSDSYGFRVVGASESSTFTRVLVKATQIGPVLCSLDGGTLAYQGSRSAKVRRFVSGSSQPDSGLTITVYDAFLDSTDDPVADGTYLEATEYGGRWVATQRRGCP